MTKITLRNYEELQRWAVKRLETSSNIFDFDTAIREIQEAYKGFCLNNFTSIEVEKKMNRTKPVNDWQMIDDMEKYAMSKGQDEEKKDD